MADATTSSEILHMVQLWLDTRRMTELAKMLGLPMHRLDTNYMVHCALAKLFQERAPIPFSIETQRDAKERHDPRFLRVLGYSTLPGDALHELAKAFAEPAIYNICNFDRLASKPLPERFPEGVILGFETRVCPVIRKSSNGPKWRKGQEVDAFLAHVWELQDETELADRETIYVNWLNDYFSRQGAVKAKEVAMTKFSLEKMVRRTQGKARKATYLTRPDVVLTGKLQIADSKGFHELLSKGIGRHRSFGYGMLKVRRLIS